MDIGTEIGPLEALTLVLLIYAGSQKTDIICIKVNGYQSRWYTYYLTGIGVGKREKLFRFSYSNAEEVELFVNNISYGKKRMGIEKTPIPINFIDWEGGRYQGNYMSPYRLMWEVPYQAGELKVVAYEDDLAVSKKIINTASEPIRIELTADRDKLLADGKDISFISVRVVDKDGNLCPRADNLIEFDVSELGIIEAVGNGDPATTAPLNLIKDEHLMVCAC